MPIVKKSKLPANALLVCSLAAVASPAHARPFVAKWLAALGTREYGTES
jgi:hypothetical protein